MSANLLILDPSKTEFLLIGHPKQLIKISNPSLSPSPATAIHPSALGFTLSNYLNFSEQLSCVSKRCFLPIRDLRRLWPSLNHKTACIVVTYKLVISTRGGGSPFLKASEYKGGTSHRRSQYFAMGGTHIFKKN
jgi:hypothetical protein